MSIITCLTASADPNPASIHADSGAWPLYRQWNPAEVKHYAAWIENTYQRKWRGTYEQRLAKLEGVLTDPEINRLLDPAFVGTPSNPQLDFEIIREVHEVLDCGKLAVMLPAYYAYRRGLPWMGTRIRSGDGTDIRRASHNIIASEFSCRDFDTPGAFIREVVTTFCTGNYRINPIWPTANLSDTVPVAINPRDLTPGALYYLDGHVAILGKVTPLGGLRFLDATLAETRDIYTHNGYNMVTGLIPRKPGDKACLGCFRGFRIYRFPIAVADASGKVIRVRRRTDAEMKSFGYSLEQYDRLAEQHAKGTINTPDGPIRGLHNFIRYRMRTAATLDPQVILTRYVIRLADKLASRQKHVQAGWAEVRKNGPIPFPDAGADNTIYNATGRWGVYSTVTRDLELREDYAILLEEIAEIIRSYGRNPDTVRLSPEVASVVRDEQSLATWIVAEKRRLFDLHYIEYRDSAGSMRTLRLSEIEARLYDLSFDPNHPPELRWGGAAPSAANSTHTPLASGGRLPVNSAYTLQAPYRVRTYRTVEATPLRRATTQPYNTPDLFDAYIQARWPRS